MDFGDALNKALREEMRRDPRVFCIGEDIVLGVPFGVTKGLCEEFGPERVLNAPISEAAIVGSAMGAAMTGLVPVVDMHFADFVTCAMDEVANQIAKSRYMFGGQIDCPITLRMPYGIGRSGGGHHSNSVEAWFVNIPGLKLCIPSTPADRARLADSVRRTHRVVIAEEGPMRGSTGAWLAWVIMEECFDDLDAPIARVAGPNVPIPFSPPLEAFATPKAEDVEAAVRQVVK